MNVRAHRRVVLLAATVFVAVVAVPHLEAHAKKEPTELQINVGLGPSLYWFFGPLEMEQAPHYGAALRLFVVPPKETVMKKAKRAPGWIKRVLRRADEIRIGHFLIPDAIILSPGENTQIYGGTWRFLKVGAPLIPKPFRLWVGTGILLTYAYIDTDLDDDEALEHPKLNEGTTHFFRPGLDARAEVEIFFSKSFALGLGWSSGFYIPQELGGDIFAIGKGKTRGIWHVGQAFGVLHFRIPYTVKI